MIRFFDVTIDPKIKVLKGLNYIFGLGFVTCKKICYSCSISTFASFNDLSLRQRNALLSFLTMNFLVGSDFEQAIRSNIKKKILKKTFVGLRHSKGIPVRGQRTKTNAITSRRLKFKE
jgi:small subunit ribosomal protein S13